MNDEIKLKIKNIYNMSFSNNVRILIEKAFLPTINEIKENAEISTPVKLVDEMLSKIPIDFWITPKNIFEPCCGKGNFILAIFDKFYDGLKDIIPNKFKRCEIIIDCIYYSDINPFNVFITTELLKFHIKYYCFLEDDNLNLDFHFNTGNTLILNVFSKRGITGFDAIIGNPPYEEINQYGISKGGGNNLYSKFIYFADINLLKNGYILFITPPTFFSIGKSNPPSYFNIIRDNNINNRNLRKEVFNNYYFHFINLNECSKHFKVDSKFIYYLIQKNNKININLEVICKYNKKNYNSFINQQIINDLDHLPYLLTNDSINILFKIKNYQCEKITIINRNDNNTTKKHISKIKIDNFKFPIRSTGNQLFYSKYPCKNQYDKKILMSRSGYLKSIYDDGIIGIGGHCLAIIVIDENESKNLLQLLNSDLYKFYIDINKWSGFHHIKVLRDLPYIKEVNDNLYLTFGLTDNEIKFIKNI